MEAPLLMEHQLPIPNMVPNIMDSHIVTYVDVSETDTINNYIKEKGVQPLFENN